MGKVALHLILMQAPSWTYRLSGRQDVSANTHLIPGGNHALLSTYFMLK
jgi:hypothetical protein